MAVARTTRAAIARGDIQHAKGGMPPGVLHIRWQRHLGKPGERRRCDIRPVGGKHRSDTLVERHGRTRRRGGLRRCGGGDDRTQGKSHGLAAINHGRILQVFLLRHDGLVGWAAQAVPMSTCVDAATA
jgi:hypothetical protein